MRQWPRASVLGRHRRDEQQRRWLAVWVAFVILWVVGSALAADSSSKDEKDRSGEFSVPRDIRRPQNYGMSTLADYPRLLAEDDDEEEGQIMTPPKEQQMPLEVPTIQLADILPSTGFLVVRDKVTGSILSNSTTFFVAPDLVVTAAHSVAPLIRRFAVNLQVITNSRSSGGSRTFNVTALAYDATNAPCQIVLQVNGNHTHTLPLSKHPAEDGSMVRVVSNSPIGFGGIHLDGLVSRVFDVWSEGTEQQCYRDRSISMYNWYCEQEKFLISAPTWAGASGSPVIAATGVIGTVETSGPHTGTAIAASTHGLVLPAPTSFVPLDTIQPALLCDETCSSEMAHSGTSRSILGLLMRFWHYIHSAFSSMWRRR